MQLRDEVILNVFSSNLVNDVFTLLAIRQLLNDPWALCSLSSILEPPQTLKRHAKRTSWNKNHAWFEMWPHTCMQHAWHLNAWKETIQEATNSRPIPWCHVCIWSGGLSHGPPPGSVCRRGGGSRTGFSSEGRSDLHCAETFMLYQSWANNWRPTRSSMYTPKSAAHGAWEIQRIDSSGTFSGWWSLSIVNGIFLTVRRKQKPCTDTCMHAWTRCFWDT